MPTFAAPEAEAGNALGDSSWAFAAAELGEESAGFDFVPSWFEGNWFDGNWLSRTLSARVSFARASAAGLVWFASITIAAGNEIGFAIPTADTRLETVTEEASAAGLPGPEALPDRALLADADWSTPVTVAAPLGVMGTGWRLASPACILLSGASGLTAAASSGVPVCGGVAGTGWASAAVFANSATDFCVAVSSTANFETDVSADSRLAKLGATAPSDTAAICPASASFRDTSGGPSSATGKGTMSSAGAGVGLPWVIDAVVASDRELTGGRVEPAVATERLITCGGTIVGRLRAITECDFASPITTGPAGISCPNAFVVDFSVVFFSGDLPRSAPAGGAGSEGGGAGARALCKVLAKLLEPGLPEGNGTAN